MGISNIIKIGILLLLAGCAPPLFKEMDRGPPDMYSRDGTPCWIVVRKPKIAYSTIICDSSKRDRSKAHF